MTDARTTRVDAGDVAGAVFPDGGDLGALCRALDWGATPLGPIDGWPESLKAVAGLVVASPSSMIVLWGPELVQIYNDAYRPVLGARHPGGLGQPNRECWPEVWEFNGPIYEGVTRRRETFTFENQRLVIERHGYPEEAFFTLAFSPVPAEGGRIGGVLVTVMETTSEIRRREAEQARQQVQDQLQNTLESIADGFHACDAEYRFLYVNSAAERMLGIRREDVLGRSLWDVFPHTRNTRLERELRRAAAGEVVDFEHYDEPWQRWFHNRIYPRPGGGISVYLQEVTERKRAEAELRESEERFRAVLESSLDLSYRRDLRADRYDYLSPMLGEVLGIELAQMEGMPSSAALERIHPEDRERVAEVMEQAMRTRSGRVEYRFRFDDGSYRWVADSFSVQTDAAGTPIYRTGVVRDVHHQKQAEEELKAREAAERALSRALAAERAKLAAVIENLPVGVGIEDPEGRTMSLNRAGLALHGFASEEEMLERLDQYANEFELRYLDGRSMPVEDWPASRALRGEYVRGFELRLLNRAEGNERVVSYDVVPVRNPDGSVAMLVYVMQDLTLRKEAEVALREAKEAAERASLAKSQFLSTMSHELRTPLTAVIGLADLLDSGVVGSVTPRQQEFLARIKASAWHLVTIIDEILTFTRAEAGKEEVQLADVDVAEIARSVVGMLTVEAQVRRLALRLTGADERVVALTDGAKVRQILVNLVGNAVKYTDHGSIDVELIAGKEELLFRVRDTGRGIPEHRLEDIFQPFVQVDQSATREKGGTGLGLSIARRLARRLGGDVTVDSAAGAGSTFTLRVPRRPPSER